MNTDTLNTLVAVLAHHCKTVKCENCELKKCIVDKEMVLMEVRNERN